MTNEVSISNVSPFTFQYVSINTLIYAEISTSRIYLHSNMFLLILYTVYKKGTKTEVFTVQYVSINTDLDIFCMVSFSNLHSNMFLLIQIHRLGSEERENYLHSNMFLLIQQLIRKKGDTHLHLHSNMFLLIRHGSDICLSRHRIYIPICFY